MKKLTKYDIFLVFTIDRGSGRGNGQGGSSGSKPTNRITMIPVIYIGYLIIHQYAYSFPNVLSELDIVF